jgi:pimeloyl-ACP methyl ester carboxylesterase
VIQDPIFYLLAAPAVILLGFSKGGLAGVGSLSLPMLVLAGEKGSGEALVKQAQLIGTDVQGTFVPGAGHWLLEEAPGYVIPKIVEFLGQQPNASSSE